MQWVRVKLIKEARPAWATRIRDREDVHAMLKRYYRFHDREEALIICLDNRTVPTHIHSLAVGSINQCIIDPRSVFTVGVHRRVVCGRGTNYVYPPSSERRSDAI